MTQAARFRELLRQDGMVVAPGAYDCITARLIERAGFDAVYMTGAGTAATLGYPDFGIVTMSEMVANAGRIAAAVGLPVIADADTGYGNELNVVRTVREYETVGVAGIHIEDQEFPKKCGHLDDKRIVPREDWVAKIRAAAPISWSSRAPTRAPSPASTRRSPAPMRRSPPAPTWRLSRRRRPSRRSPRCRASSKARAS